MELVACWVQMLAFAVCVLAALYAMIAGRRDRTLVATGHRPIGG